MLMDCPDCGHRVSDRAAACPSCGFPIAEILAERQRAERRAAVLASRAHVGVVDCVPCQARGFIMGEKAQADGSTLREFTWCLLCEHSGRVPLASDLDGFYAVAYGRLEAFLRGEADADGKTIFHLGSERPQGFRYPQAGDRVQEEPEEE